MYLSTVWVVGGENGVESGKSQKERAQVLGKANA